MSILESPYPNIDAALVERLDAQYPERSADRAWTDRDVWIKAGERNVVRALKEQLRQQEAGGAEA